MSAAAPAEPRARALVAGPSALRTLRRPARGSVELLVAGGAYLRLESGWLLVVGPRAPLGPLSLTVSGLRPGVPVVTPGSPAHSDGRVLTLAGLQVMLAGVREQTRQPPPPRARAGVGRALEAALGACPAPPPALAPGLEALARAGSGEREVNGLAQAVAMLAGRGDGLTPAGDDILAGFAAWRHADGSSLPLSTLAVERSSPLGLAYLRCAERGELPVPAERVLGCLRGGREGAAAAAARGLKRWGDSSGAALLWGMAAAAR